MHSGNPQFICIEKSWMTFGPDDQCTWENPQPDNPLLPLKADTEEGVRQMLNAYLSSKEAIAQYGQKLELMAEGKTKLDPQLTCRHGRYWKWSFEIVPFVVAFENFSTPAQMHPCAYMQLSMMEARN